MRDQPNERLKQLVDGPEETLDLAEAALLIAREEYPQLDVAAYLQRLDELAEIVRGRLPSDAAPEHVIATINYFFYKEQGFTGNATDYYDPRNSFLNDVLDRKLGVPITLSIVYMEVGRRLGLPLQGVSFPGHFLIKLPTTQGTVVLDPYAGGISLSEEDLEMRLTQVYGEFGQKVSLDEALASAGKKDILVRMLRNLKAIYMRNKALTKALWAVDRMLLVLPDQPQEVRDRGLIYQELECSQAALSDLSRYLELAPDAADAQAIRTRVVDLHQQANALH
ncbi:MAG: SirB1 family protein [Acidiferrobacterales bacterium]